MFQFPFGTMHQLNLDWFLQQWEIYKQEWADAQAGIDNALQGEIDRVEDAMQDLYDARDAAVQAKEDAEDAADSVVGDAAQCGADALKSEGYAVGEQDGTPVGAGSPYYQQNAKYYKVEAGTYRYLSEAYAKGEMGGSPVAPGEAGYQDNAKYYKDAAAADRVQTGLDRTATGNDALATAADRLAVSQDKDDTDLLKDAANAAALRAEGYSSGTQNGTPVSSGSPYYENNAAYFYGLSAGTSGDLAQDMIADEETSSVSANTYNKGDFFRLNGILYKATEEINIGDTITPGTNCEVTTVGEELAEQANNAAENQAYNNIRGYRMNILNAIPGNPLKIKLLIPYRSTATSQTNIEIHRNNVLISENQFIADYNLDSSGTAIESPNRWLTDFIDVSSSNTWYLRVIYAWGSSFRMRVWTYNANKEPVSELYSNATSNRNVYITLNTNNAKYLRFALPMYTNPVRNIYAATILTTSQREIETYALTDFYGGELDLVNGVSISKYDSAGELLPTPVESSVAPYIPVSSDNMTVFQLATNNNGVVNETELVYPITAESNKKIIESIITENIEDTFVSSKAYVVNDLIIILDKLYRVTSPIPAGAAISTSTNVSQTTIGNIIKEILNS